MSCVWVTFPYVAELAVVVLSLSLSSFLFSFFSFISLMDIGNIYYSTILQCEEESILQMFLRRFSMYCRERFVSLLFVSLDK